MNACIAIAPPTIAVTSSADPTCIMDRETGKVFSTCGSVLSCDRVTPQESLIVWPVEKRSRCETSSTVSTQVPYSPPNSGLSSQWSLPKTTFGIQHVQSGPGAPPACQEGTGGTAEADASGLLQGLASELRESLMVIDRKLEQLTKQTVSGFDKLKKELREDKRESTKDGLDSIQLGNPHPLLQRSDTKCNITLDDVLNEQKEPGRQVSPDQKPKETLFVSENSNDKKSKNPFAPEVSYENKENPYRKFSRTGSLEFLTGGVKQMMWDFLEDPESSWAAYLFSRFTCLLILISTYGTLYQTVTDPMFSRSTATVVELCVDSWFLVEFSLRFSVSIKTKLFFRNIYNVIDLLAATPLALRWVCIFDLEGSCGRNDMISLVLDGFVPVLRLLKIMRCFKHSFLIIKLLRITGEAMLMLLYMMMVMVLLFSAFLYIVEDRVNIESMLASMWLTIVTLTTVGYGDVAPVSPKGKVVGSILMLISVLYMAMPIGVIGNAFTNIWHDRDRILLVMKTRARLNQMGFGAMDCHRIFTHFDLDNNGSMDITEFRCMVLDMMPDIQEERVIRLYDMFDKDGSGSIEFDEFIRTLFPDEYHQVFKEVQEVKLKRSNFRSAPEDWRDLEEEDIKKGRSSIASGVSTGMSSTPSSDKNDYTASYVKRQDSIPKKRVSLSNLPPAGTETPLAALQRFEKRRNSG